MPNALSEETSERAPILIARDCGGAECNAAASITCARKEIAILPGAVKHWVKTNIKHEPAAHERGLAPDRASYPRLLPAVTAPELTALPIGEIAVEGIESGLEHVESRAYGLRQERLNGIRLDHDVGIDVNDPLRRGVLGTQVAGDRESLSLIGHDHRAVRLSN